MNGHIPQYRDIAILRVSGLWSYHFVVTAFLVYEKFQGERSPESLLFRCSHIFSTFTGIGMSHNIGATSFLVTVSGKCVQYLICTLML